MYETPAGHRLLSSSRTRDGKHLLWSYLDERLDPYAVLTDTHGNDGFVLPPRVFEALAFTLDSTFGSAATFAEDARRERSCEHLLAAAPFVVPAGEPTEIWVAIPADAQDVDPRLVPALWWVPAFGGQPDRWALGFRRHEGHPLAWAAWYDPDALTTLALAAHDIPTLQAQAALAGIRPEEGAHLARPRRVTPGRPTT